MYAIKNGVLMSIEDAILFDDK